MTEDPKGEGEEIPEINLGPREIHHRTAYDQDVVNPLYEAEGWDEDAAVPGWKKGAECHPRRPKSGDKTAAVEFAWAEVEGAEPPDPERLADQVVADCLAWVMSFCLSGARTLKTKGAQSVAFRRFVSLAYIYRPDLIKGRTIRQIANEIGVSHQAVNRYISEISIQLGASGVNQQAVNYRLACRLRQLRRRTQLSSLPVEPAEDPRRSPSS